jgi:hypothetical protein
MAGSDTDSAMKTMIRGLTLQYSKCLKMIRETITRYDEEFWADAEAFESPAWQIVYHALYYANRYCSPTEGRIRQWPKRKDRLHRFAGTSSALPKETISASAYSKSDMLEFVEFVEQNVPHYLAAMRPQERCWPSWYDETQFEFQLNNLRHIQHHIGQANERQNNLEPFDYWWYGE